MQNLRLCKIHVSPPQPLSPTRIPRRSLERAGTTEFARARIGAMSARERQVLEGSLAGRRAKSRQQSIIVFACARLRSELSAGVSAFLSRRAAAP